MKISYAIPVCNEHEELKRLLEFLVQNIEENDEIVVQCDQGNTTPEVYKVLDQIDQSWQNKVHEQIVGISTKGLLPMEEEWCLYHPKDIKRQEIQNNFYDTL